MRTVIAFAHLGCMSETFQIPLAAAEYYEARFVPDFFAQWAPRLCSATRTSAGERVLDVGCGTGIAARTAADLVGPTGQVTGLDCNTAMLAVAARVRPELSWQPGHAGALPFSPASFDVVLCQMALMFFGDREGSLREMARVTAPGGRVGVLVPSELGRQAMFARFVEVAVHHAGPEAEPLLSSYFACGAVDELSDLVERAGLRVMTQRVETGHYRAPSVEAVVANEVESTPLRERIDDDLYARLREDARSVLAPYTTPDGRFDAPFAVNLVVATVT